MRKISLVAAAVFILAVWASAQTQEQTPNFSPVQTNEEAVAIDGYDVVSYFDNNTAKKGTVEFQCEYQGNTWYFTSQENRDRFLSNPEQFTPQFGGYCAHSIGNTSKLIRSDPNAFLVRDDKLFLYRTEKLRDVDSERSDNRFGELFTKRETNWFEYGVNF